MSTYVPLSAQDLVGETILVLSFVHTNCTTARVFVAMVFVRYQ